MTFLPRPSLWFPCSLPPLTSSLAPDKVAPCPTCLIISWRFLACGMLVTTMTKAPPDYLMLRPRRKSASHALPWESEISPDSIFIDSFGPYLLLIAYLRHLNRVHAQWSVFNLRDRKDNLHLCSPCKSSLPHVPSELPDIFCTEVKSRLFQIRLHLQMAEILHITSS